MVKGCFIPILIATLEPLVAKKKTVELKIPLRMQYTPECMGCRHACLIMSNERMPLNQGFCRIPSVLKLQQDGSSSSVGSDIVIDR